MHLNNDLTPPSILVLSQDRKYLSHHIIPYNRIPSAETLSLSSYSYPSWYCYGTTQTIPYTELA